MPGEMLATCFEEVGLLHCRLSDRDNAELSTGHGDIGRKEGLSLANLLGNLFSPPYCLGPLLVPCKYLNVAVCSS